MDNLAILCFLTLFPLPFAALWLLRPQDGDAEALIDSLAVGAALAFCLLYVCALLSIKFFWAVWLAAALIAASGFVAGRSRARFETSTEVRSLCVLLLISLALRLAPAFFEPFPQGLDPYFHLVLADKVLQADSLVYDWRPYEVTSLNYPLGSHVLLAIASLTLGAPLHTVFLVAIPVFATFTAAQVHVVAWRATGDRTLALYAATAYAFMAVLGSLDYLNWGGLPNLIGIYLFLGLLSQLMREDRWNWRSAGAFAVLFVALSLVHHHVMLAAAASLGWMLLSFLLRKDAPRFRRVVQGLALSGVLGFPYFAWYLLRSPQIGDTAIFSYLEQSATDRTDFVTEFGALFLLAVLFGVLLYFFGPTRRAISPVVLQSLVALLLCFAVLHYGSRVVSGYLLGEVIAPFTPSRFLTDAVTLLSLFAGIFLLEVGALLRWSRRFLLSLVALSIGFNFPAYALGFRPVVPAEKLAAFRWLREHADADALIFEPNHAAAYLTRRASSHMPYPASEPHRNAEIRRLIVEIQGANGGVPASAGPRQIISLIPGNPKGELPLGISPSQVLWTHPTGLMAIQLHPR